MTVADQLRPKPPVKRRCLICYRFEWRVKTPGIVSPSGIEHHGADFGMTACGRDATVDKWWWPL